ncbi:Asp23/Gls24 family envelope stress response protein [Alkalithermobacter paradoxus]|uniref:Uncharacterized protein n=1 Tax=Alkalithermobacter paradoxus TaxID=29349 RepID=A0A1V4I7S4_9FIRM|nr:hypothetical protein CLOTH_11940 [[Clostridium] thermoalcaliphilum]
MKVYSLVGPSGTGKSYRALKVSYENDIEYIIDDGILIHKNKIIAGVSAKRASTKMEAVRRAIFEDVVHKNKVKEAIKRNNVDKILVIGTSRRMINIICDRLELGKVHKEISIYDIATKEEIEKAKTSRLQEGIHIVPLPTFEVKRHFSGMFRNPIKLLFKNKNSEVEEVEKTLVRPTFSYLGKYFISERAIIQIIDYEISNLNEDIRVYAIEVSDLSKGIEINIKVGMKYGNLISPSYKIQQNILKSLENMTLLNILAININIVRIYFDK